jgi:N-acetylneuraminic acid mutarotase
MEEAEKSMSITKDKLTNYDVSLRKINISENNESNFNPDILKKFTYSRYVSLFRQDFDMQNLEKWSELICQKSPKRRCYHVSFIYKDFLYVLAGMDINEGKMNDLFRVNINLNSENFLKWEEVTVSGSHPSELSYLQGALDFEGGKFYIFGGENIYQRYPNDLFIFDIEKKNFVKKTFEETVIPGMTGHTLNYHPETHSLVLFGGFAKGAYLNAVYVYDIEANSWSKINPQEESSINNEHNESDVNHDNSTNNRPNTNNTYRDINNNDYPCGRMLHSATINNDYLYVFGGKTGDGIYLNDLWRFSLFSKTWEKVKVEGEVPKGRSGHTMANCESLIYIFGGKVGDLQERNEFWKFDVDKNSFALIHDTMLEQHVESQNDVSIAYKEGYSKKITRSNFKFTLLLI